MVVQQAIPPQFGSFLNDLKKLKKRIDILTPKPPQTGLVPIPYTPFLGTPGLPADPTDCNRYPSSPFCGGNPLTSQIVGFQVRPVIGVCEIGIEITPILGFIKLPPIQIVYRFPNCRQPPPILTIPPVNTEVLPAYPPNYCADDDIAMLVIPKIYSFKEEKVEGITAIEPGWMQGFHWMPGNSVNLLTAPMVIEHTYSFHLIDFEYPYNGSHLINEYDYYNNIYYKIKPKAYIKYSIKNISTYNEAYRIHRLPDIPQNSNNIYSSQTGGTFEHYISPSYYDRFDLYPGQLILEKYNSRFVQPFILFKYQNPVYLIDSGNYKKPLISYDITSSDIGSPQHLEYETYHTWNEKVIWQIDVRCRNYNTAPPPPQPPHPCCMTCCPSPTQNNALLQLILQKVEKLSEIVGVDEYPLSVPESIITEEIDFTGKASPNPDISIPNLTNFISWFFQRVDEIAGQWEIPIEIKDTDPTTPGDQPQGFKLKNMAEFAAEIFGIGMQASINAETLVNMTTRLLLETGQDKQQNYKTYMLLQSLVDYMGYKYKDKIIDMPLTFTPGKERLDELLEESNLKIVVSELDEKFNLQSNILRYNKAASILDSVFFKKVNPFLGDLATQLLDDWKNSDILSKGITGDANDDFDKFVDEAEKGFSDIQGIANPQEPYGRPYDERPKIKRLDNPNS